jgi:hypothetical protein
MGPLRLGIFLPVGAPSHLAGDRLVYELPAGAPAFTAGWQLGIARR